MGVLDTLLNHGGFATYLILGAATALLVIGTDRLLALYFRLSYNATAALTTIRGYILERKYTEALQVCNAKANAPDITVVKAGIMAVENGREAMKSALGGAILEVSHRCEKRVGYIALIANVATLLGLLGTITGLIKTFASIANADPAEKAKLLGVGISEAMYATAAGLVVGIVAMVVHTLCSAKSDSIIGSAQEAGLNLVTWIEQSERSRQG